MRAIREERQMTDGVYVVKNGQSKRVTPPESGFGKQTITWENGKPTRWEVSFTEKA